MILGISLIIISFYFIFNKSFQIKPSKFNGISSGLISKIFEGLFNIFGPPLVIYYFSSIEDKKEYHSTIQTTFYLLLSFTISIQLFYGNITKEILKMALIGSVAVLIVTIIGLNIFNSLDRNLLRKILSFVMIVMGIILII